VAQVSAAWDKLAKLLKRGGPAPDRPRAGAGADAQAAWREKCRKRRSYLSEYAMVLEVGGRGNKQLHAHVLITGRFIYQADFSQWARQCGFGRIADVREVERGDAKEVGGYAAKQLAGYASKTGQALALADLAQERCVPFVSVVAGMAAAFGRPRRNRATSDFRPNVARKVVHHQAQRCAGVRLGATALAKVRKFAVEVASSVYGRDDTSSSPGVGRCRSAEDLGDGA
jgi:hypothetical protein